MQERYPPRPQVVVDEADDMEPEPCFVAVLLWIVGDPERIALRVAGAGGLIACAGVDLDSVRAMREPGDVLAARRASKLDAMPGQKVLPSSNIG